MNDQPTPPEPKKAPERDPQRLETWPALRAFPELADQMRNPPEPKQEPLKPEPERKANTKDLEHKPERDYRSDPSPGGGRVINPRARSAEPTPEPQPQPEKQNPVAAQIDILEQARKQIAERGGAGGPLDRTLSRQLEISPSYREALKP